MKTYRRLIKFSMLLFAITLALCVNVSAKDTYEIPIKEHGRYVYDEESTIKSKNLEKIESWCEELDEKTNIQIFVITFKDINGKTVAPYLKASEVHMNMVEEGKETITIFASEKEKKIVVKSTDGVNIQNVGHTNLFYAKLVEKDFSDAITLIVENFIKVLTKKNDIQIDNTVEEQPDIKEQLVKNILLVVITIIVIIAFSISIIVNLKVETERATRRR